ncbi:SusC/RagA family TonB-linked outer membrane protein [Belliella sp. DSM 111904]|uniref:SusC/RagA family TonB-linked outer membrane protein n=1 Tax=Belliella filtrata TaxID=2923435 RepID=A0ABS9UVE2_9BACT|nr:SusC/RagA family TonB-linked outer membrane protein [Belliella filtrata]MCH7408140.1 SusC/RagA family TonB-linked outer membrane protein [Belliella filtrata]
MRKFYFIILLLTCFLFESLAQDITTLMGQVKSQRDGLSLPGAIVTLKGESKAAIADADGLFTLDLPNGESVILVSYIGFETFELKLILPYEGLLQISLEEVGLDIDQIEIVSTGYQQLPKERATGSFAYVSEELINRRVSTNLIDRLADVTSGLTLNRSNADPIGIRGRSTLFANPNPLIIIDDFPYDGPLENINPNDVESITVLKDAAASSIWGARAGNGVIVITTKKGNVKSPLRVSLNTNITITEMPDFFYRPQMSVNDYIDTEITLFNNNFFNSRINNPRRLALSPVVELLLSQRNGEITEAQMNQQINAFRQFDSRDQFGLFYQNQVFSQTALNLSGGSEYFQFNTSIGFDENQSSSLGDQNNRFTINSNQTIHLLNNRLKINSAINMVQSVSKNNSMDPSRFMLSSTDPRMYPYAAYQGSSGEALELPRDYRVSYLNSLEEAGLKDWFFRPLQERDLMDDMTRQNEIRLNLNTSYKIHENLTADLRYQYWTNRTNRSEIIHPDAYEARNLFNSFAYLDNAGTIQSHIPEGGIFNQRLSEGLSHTFRTNLTYSNIWDTNHRLTALAGYEAKDLQRMGHNSRQYGYNPEIAGVSPVDYMGNFPMYFAPNVVQRIPFGESQTGIVDRFISYFANAGYEYKSRYILSLSARKDQSNLFGVETNMRGVPLWSAGLGWIISDENFFDSGLFPYLKVRATYGYSGNVDNSLSAYTTARFSPSSPFTGLPFSTVVNPPNPNLRWERLNMLNLAIDFSTKNNRISGTLEYYHRAGEDMIGFAAVAPSSGVRNFRGNTATIKGEGVDIELNSLNIDRALKWSTSFLFNFYQDEVTGYNTEHPINTILNFGLSSMYPVTGYGMFPVFSYRWAGLDPDNGNPQGILDGEVSTDYLGITRDTGLEDLVYHGTARPNVFGALRNDFSWKGFSLSVNLTYRLGYYYRRESIIYSNHRGLGGHGDYAQRWQNPGDELITNVPSIPNATNTNRDNLYTFSEALVEPGDHIRLQDIRLAYFFDKGRWSGLPFRNAEIYFYANNLGILWKASKDPIDPDFRSMRPLRSLAGGVRINF